jgi:hypothetical protein
MLPAVHPAAFHPLTPGNPAYAIAKISAIGGLIGLRVALSRRSKRAADAGSAEEPVVEQRPARPHPVSSRKARRRSRKRR